MRQYSDRNVVANRARMLRGEYRAKSRSVPTCLIVEGDSDARVYSNFVDETKCFLVIAHGKAIAIASLTLLERDGRFGGGVLAIVDADFDLLMSVHPPSDNLLLTDTHDLETMILKSPAFTKFMRTFVPADKVRFVAQLAENARRTIVDLARPIGCLRWFSEREGLSLKFDSIYFPTFIDRHKLTVNTRKMISEVLRRSPVPPLAESELQRETENLAKQGHDPWCVCHGHDAMCILVLTLPKLLSTFTPRDRRSEFERRLHDRAGERGKLEGTLALCYEFRHFKQTQLCASVRHWELVNTPFKVLEDVP